MNITNELLKGASSFLSKVVYQVHKRELVLVVVGHPEKMNEVQEIIFPEILLYTEKVDEIDDDLMEGIIGIHWFSSNQICIKTDTREIIVTLNGKPYVQSIT